VIFIERYIFLQLSEEEIINTFMPRVGLRGWVARNPNS
jgi:hypothetical protein